MRSTVVSRKALLILWAVVLAIFLVASWMFFAQGGFGGGHGRFDMALGLLASPWLWVIPETAWVNDFAAVVLIPFLINAALILLLQLFLARRRRARGSEDL